MTYKKKHITMKPAILKRDIIGKNYSLRKGEKVYIAQDTANGILVCKDKDSTIYYPCAKDALRIVSDDVKVKIHVKRQPRRNDAMFYYGKHIATVSKGHRNLFIESSGEMEGRLKDNGKLLLNEGFYRAIKRKKLTDKGLGKLQDLITMNNWFRITDSETNGEVGIIGTYDDAIQLAKDTLNEK